MNFKLKQMKMALELFEDQRFSNQQSSEYPNLNELDTAQQLFEEFLQTNPTASRNRMESHVSAISCALRGHFNLMHGERRHVNLALALLEFEHGITDLAASSYRRVMQNNTSDSSFERMISDDGHATFKAPIHKDGDADLTVLNNRLRYLNAKAVSPSFVRHGIHWVASEPIPKQMKPTDILCYSINGHAVNFTLSSNEQGDVTSELIEYA